MAFRSHRHQSEQAGNSDNCTSEGFSFKNKPLHRAPLFCTFNMYFVSSWSAKVFRLLQSHVCLPLAHGDMLSPGLQTPGWNLQGAPVSVVGSGSPSPLSTCCCTLILGGSRRFLPCPAQSKARLWEDSMLCSWARVPRVLDETLSAPGAQGSDFHMRPSAASWPLRLSWSMLRNVTSYSSTQVSEAPSEWG